MDRRKIFTEAAIRKFEFLTRCHGFTGPHIEGQESFVLKVYYTAQNLAIELVHDGTEDDVTCFISKLTDGRKTSHYRRNGRGDLVREYLSELIRNRGIRENPYTNVAGLPFDREVEALMDAHIKMLEGHGRPVLNDDPSFVTDEILPARPITWKGRLPP